MLVKCRMRTEIEQGEREDRHDAPRTKKEYFRTTKGLKFQLCDLSSVNNPSSNSPGAGRDEISSEPLILHRHPQWTENPNHQTQDPQASKATLPSSSLVPASVTPAPPPSTLTTLLLLAVIKTTWKLMDLHRRSYLDSHIG